MSDARKDVERETFEQTFGDQYTDFERFENGEYMDDFLQQSWIGWQASREALATLPPNEHGKNRYGLDSVPEETLTAIHDTLRLVWSRELSADDGMDEIEILIPPTKTDEWIKCSERLPKESDGDCHGIVWVYDKGLSWVEISGLEDVKFISDYTHWMPTNFVRPEPPKQEEGHE
jgi:hypothetical protein